MATLLILYPNTTYVHGTLLADIARTTVLLEFGDAFKLHKLQQEATTNTSTLVRGRTLFAVAKTEKEVVEARKISVPKKIQIEPYVHILVSAFLYTLALATWVMKY